MRFFYLRDRNNHPIGCLATELHKASGEIKYDVVQYALSICNPLDHFKREQARALAAGRLATQLPTYITIAPTDPPGQIKSRILHNIAVNPRFPQRARDAAARWLVLNNKEWAEGAYNAAFAKAIKEGQAKTGDPKQTDSRSASEVVGAMVAAVRPCGVCGDEEIIGEGGRERHGK